MRRKLFIPEVIQTSAMDCGPASLKALFGGFGLYLSYGRLREACQTDVDGASIDTLEEIANQLGLEASQTMMPADLVLLPECDCLPAIAVLRLAGGATHFVVAWRVHGPLIQVMDPSAGRIWMPRQRFLDSLYIHEQTVPRAAWAEWAQSDRFQAALRHRIRALQCSVDVAAWPDTAHLDAALRFTGALSDAGQVRPGPDAADVLARAQAHPSQIPDEFWTARPKPDDPSQVILRGAVLVQANGKRKEGDTAAIPDSLRAVLMDPPPRPWAPVWKAIRQAGLRQPALIALALLIAAMGTMVEALLFRGLFDLGRHLNLSGQRAAAMLAFTAFLAGLLALEWGSQSGLLRLGRQVENRLRTLFLAKIPRLNDRYFQSRLISDMAFRAHSIQLLRQLPELCGQFLHIAFTLACTVGAIAWLYPTAFVPAFFAAAASVLIPVLFQPALTERDLRFREMSGSLSRFYMSRGKKSSMVQSMRTRTLRSMPGSFER